MACRLADPGLDESAGELLGPCRRREFLRDAEDRIGPGPPRRAPLPGGAADCGLCLAGKVVYYAPPPCHMRLRQSRGIRAPMVGTAVDHHQHQWEGAKGYFETDRGAIVGCRPTMRDDVSRNRGCPLFRGKISQADTGSSVAHTPAAGANHTGPDGAVINRTFLLWEKEDISKVG